ncbi:hypothetical protein IEZ26_22135 [Nocardioides cavernae]|uniref:Uncharacterized protein n=1 Tax=Nocardioides cavernae TaxID=1921566 RepID=A0ABR8NGT2_9ACTN|nr:hypothetical protein [Nocardioides cavernae]MBD3927338.1 hypothetical protein [Nocardioides cavernae]MBM7513059.1 hypothetical protein [Nocardioides cavernae]
MITVVRVLGVVALWAVGVASAFVPLLFGGTYISLALSVALWLALAAGCRALLRPLGDRVGTVAAMLTLVLAVPLLNWVSVAPKLWFQTHRLAYGAAAESSGAGNGYYGTDLPLQWRWLTVDGRVVDKEGALFFPQWYGMPDDGGGYFYSRSGSPAGADMAGMLCQAPVNFGDGWWMCGMG